MPTLDKIVTKTKSKIARDAKDKLNAFVGVIDKKLEKYFDHETKGAFGVSDKEITLSREIWEHIKEHNLRPAKRIRGSFIYYGYKLLGGNNEAAILEAATSIELVHTALLMHDDFMDEDSTRRGKPTTHEYFAGLHKKRKWKASAKHYGASMAVSAGDIALLAGYEILGRSGFPDNLKLEALNRMLRGVVNTGFGQAYDITLEATGVATEKDIIDLHYAKTGIYTYENPLQTGAILAKANPEDLEILSRYAIPGGIAFQLQDDILGLYGNPEKTGKPAHSDLRQGKMTLLIIKAFELGTTSQKITLKKIWGDRSIGNDEAAEARKIVADTGSLEYSHALSVKYARKAQTAIPFMKEKGWNKDAIYYLDGIAQYMVEREV